MWKTKQLPLLLILFFFAPFSFAASFNNDQDGKGQIDAQGRKQGRWIYYGKDRPESGIPPTGKVEEGNYRDDRKEGIWIKYHNDGITPKLKGEYENNRPKGAYTKYHANGKIKEMGYFDKMQKDSLRRYHENGQLEYEANFGSAGKETGKVTYYYANGQKEYEYYSNNGTLTGKAIRFYENGDVKEITTFNANGEVVTSEEKPMVNAAVKVKDPGGSTKKAPLLNGTPNTQGVKWSPNGYNKVYNSDKEIWQDGVFKDGKLWDGKVYVYDRDGILLKVEVFKAGVYHSDGQL